MEDPRGARILKRLQSVRDPGAWAEFLEVYSPLILRVVKMFESDPDRVSDIFVFVCEALSRRRFRRLRRFRFDGAATFSTWIQTVVRNLCMDWFRSQHGRHRQFQSIQGLPPLEQRVFRCYFEEGLSLEETLRTLQTDFASLTEQKVDEAFERVRSLLTDRQRRQLMERKSPTVCSSSDDHASSPEALCDPNPDPEDHAVAHEERQLLEKALSTLDGRSRLLIRMRYTEGMTLNQIAKLTGTDSPQKVDRQIKKLLAILKDCLQ